jgi:hypothetical protein
MSKEKSCLVTQSLIGSVDWYLTAPDKIIKEEKGGDGKITWKQKAWTDLYTTINRIETPFPEAARRGVEFEKKVYEYANKDEIGGSEEFQKVCGEVRGFLFYQKGGVNVEIAGNNCYVYAKYDAIKEGCVKDLKTTESYKKGKYLGGFQHKQYCYISGHDDFEYIIAEWDNYPKIKAIHKETYKVEDKELLIAEVHTKIEDCFDILKDLGLWKDYREKFCLY